ncbi:hypothetical protein OOZ15_18465 [Galbibacter sp. EGI 63066]|uniref:hypothetical protein n=1 Tax=Galbibacter sp. EGI 63066 TaxID=2993559 RepID=UPI0022493C6F|nr:hypothetical protein [Galbibacter sp. EGI 63066]MCX2681941.1 hypothetical protein [Galbibacter sp. EGI 63066]
MKNTIVKISLCFAVSILLVVGLFGWSQKDIIKDHGFERKLITDRISLVDAISLNKKAYYFAGHDEDTIYLGNYKTPTELIKITLPTLHTTYINIRLGKEGSIQPYKSYTVDVQPPYFYFMEGTIPILKRGMLNNWQPKRFMYDSTYFISAVPTGKKRMALKSISRKTKEYALGLEQDIYPNIELRYDILEKQIDGVFCTDGQMLFSEELSKLIYIYYYRNQFMVMDTEVKLLYRSNTIDTISQVQVKPVTTQNGAVRKLASPQFLVNRNAATNNQYLYIYATGMAKNDSYDDFKKASTIDLYDLRKQGTYSYSFRVPDYKTFKVSDFLVTNNYLVAYQGNHIVVYSLHPDIVTAI